MNEEELMRMKKIEKREKVDIALAYMKKRIYENKI